MTPLIASGDNEWAPNDPRPPKFDTPAVNRCDKPLTAPDVKMLLFVSV